MKWGILSLNMKRQFLSDKTKPSKSEMKRSVLVRHETVEPLSKSDTRMKKSLSGHETVVFHDASPKRSTSAEQSNRWVPFRDVAGYLISPQTKHRQKYTFVEYGRE